MHRRALGSFLVIVLLLAACTGPDDDAQPAPAPRDRPQASILPPADPDALDGGPEAPEAQEENTDDGRLVVETTDGQLFTILPDGSDMVELTDPGTKNAQPAWAPDGSRLAWVQIDEATGTTQIALDRYDRSDFRAVPVDDEPNYLYWDPSASRIAYLTSSVGGSDLSVAEPFAEDGPISRRLDRGEPYFLAWGPDGNELLVHASGFRLDQIDLGSATIILDEFPARFGAPSWLEDDSLVFADVEDDDQFLITTGSAGEGRRPLVTFPGELRFAVSNEGNRVVMQALPGSDEDPVVTASTEVEGPDATFAFQEPTPTPEFDDSLDAIDPIDIGIPYVMGTFGGEPFPLSTQPAVAMFPSPNGQAVAWFERAAISDDALVFKIDAGGFTTTVHTFVPSEQLRDSYFPRFDQYTQSHDFWSPSSNLFVFAGRSIGSSTDEVFLYTVETGELTTLTDGVVASFTRTPQAAGAASAL